MSGAGKGAARTRAVASVVALAAMVLAVGTLAIAGPAGGAEGDPIISVSFEPAQSQGDGCAAPESMVLDKVTTDDTYSFVVTVETDLCSPVSAAAAAYAMPDNRVWPWPQMLVEKVDVTFQDAGVTTITFAKDCDPIQFDLVNGATPDVINLVPFEPHGPLVFPHTDQFNTNGSAYQYWPPVDRCVEPTSTTNPDSPTSSTTPSSTTPVTVQPATTITTPGDTTPGVSPSGEPGVTVGGVQTTQSPAALSVAG